MFPKVKSEKVYSSKSIISGQISLFTESDFEKAVEVCKFFLPACKFIKGNTDATITATKSPALSSVTEGYTLKIKNGKVNIEYFSYSGLRNALATFSLLVREESGILTVTDTEIEDAPVLSHRSFLLDLARGVMPFDRLVNDMVLLAKAKFNFLHLHLSDSKGVAIEMDTLPEEYRIDGYYTKAQVTELIRIADVLGLEIIPEFDMPAHSVRLNTIFPELRCDTDLENPYLWTVCAGEEKVYELYEKIIKEMSTTFSESRYLHIGGDELEFADLVGESHRECHWHQCRKCKNKMRQEGLSDRQELYYYFINRINGYVKECGKQTVMWSDQIDCTKPAILSKDILMQFWRVAAKGRGPYENCSLQGQLELGYTVINSYYPNTYVDVEKYMSSQNLSEWRWDEVPSVTEDVKTQIVGSEFCAWEYGNREKFLHYDSSLPSAIFLGGDKLWSGLKYKYGKDTEIALTRAVLGASVPEDFNVFDAIGDIYPPRYTDVIPCYVDKVTSSKDEIEKIIEILSDETLFNDGDKDRAKIYKTCAEYTLGKI